MTQTITIYRREDKDTTPRGLGNPPTYHFDEPYHSDREMIWSEPVQITLPDGYTVSIANDGHQYLYDPQDNHEPVVDDHGHPAIEIGSWQNKEGKPYVRFLRLDKPVRQRV